jgi:outer membrane protein OmpA-like peptidoglycan-associated protein
MPQTFSNLRQFPVTISVRSLKPPNRLHLRYLEQIMLRSAKPLAVLQTILLLTLSVSCVKRPFIPVNEGREYGNPKTPLLVSHIPEKHQWSLNRTKSHHFFQRIVCFDYTCRRMIGRSKTLLIISKKEFYEVAKRNAERGLLFVVPNPPPKKDNSDTLALKKDAPPAKEIPPRPDEPTLKSDSLITLNEFLFETNSFKLRQEHFAELDELSEYLLANPALEVNISGHTDNTGDEKHNVTLSARRAEVVAEYLVGKGVDYDKVIFRGRGSSQPIAENATATGRSKNRRVEILIHHRNK